MKISERYGVAMLWGAIGLAVLSFVVFSRYKSDRKIVCSTEKVAFERTSTRDNTLAKGETKISVPGVDGETSTCTNKAGYYDKTTPVKSVTEVTLIGIREPEPIPLAPPPIPGYRTGAICRDGSHSFATGSGACSYHGGVSMWLYN